MLDACDKCGNRTRYACGIFGQDDVFSRYCLPCLTDPKNAADLNLDEMTALAQIVCDQVELQRRTMAFLLEARKILEPSGNLKAFAVWLAGLANALHNVTDGDSFYVYVLCRYNTVTKNWVADNVYNSWDMAEKDRIRFADGDPEHFYRVNTWILISQPFGYYTNGFSLRGECQVKHG